MKQPPVAAALSVAIAVAVLVGSGWGRGAIASAAPGAAGDRTVIDASKDPADAASNLNDFCQQIANCQFVGTAPITTGYGNPRALGDALYNCGQSYAEDTVTISDERSQSTSLEESLSVKVELGFLGLESTSLEGEVNSKQLEEVSLTNVDANEVSVAPGTKGWTDGRAGYAYATGTASINLPAHLVDVTNFTLQYPGFVTPGKQPVLYADQHANLTPAEKHDVCAALPPIAGLGEGIGGRFDAPQRAVPWIKICRRESKSVRNPSRTIRACVKRRVHPAIPMAGGKATIRLLRGTVVYATGTTGRTGVTLHAPRGMPVGEYTLLITRRRRTTFSTVFVR